MRDHRAAARDRSSSNPKGSRGNDGDMAPVKQQPYQRPNTRGRGRDNVPPRHDFIAERLKVPPKTDKRLGPNKNAWCEFHQAYSHPIRNCLALGHQLDK